MASQRIYNALRDFAKTRDVASSTKSSDFMHKIPKQLRDVNEKAYEPEVVSIGPYHYGKYELKEMEEVKVSYMKALLRRKPALKFSHYLNSIHKVEPLARDCYRGCMSLNSKEFLEMLVLDGCFIIELITQSNGVENVTYLRSKLRDSLQWDLLLLRNILQRDLLLLENQIPFFVLRILYDIIHGPRLFLGRSILIDRLVVFFKCIFPEGVVYIETLKRNPEVVKHILDLIHFNWCPPFFSETELWVSVSIPTTTSASKPMDDNPLVIPSASNLKGANVKFTFFKWSETEAPRFWSDHYCVSTNMFDVRFEDGKLVLPRLVIDGGTESLLSNLIAYEQLLPSEKHSLVIDQSLPSYRHTPVTDYALLLNNLINDKIDVQILSKYRIIHNRLGSDEAVVEFVNRLTYKITYFSNKFRYSNTFRCINTYYKKRRGVARWNKAVNQAVDEFHEKYFSSPLSFICIVAATVLLLLTVAQTVFAA